jgi:hypothetical protein
MGHALSARILQNANFNLQSANYRGGVWIILMTGSTSHRGA